MGNHKKDKYKNTQDTRRREGERGRGYLKK